VRGIWNWGVCSVVCTVRAALDGAGWGPKYEFSRRREEMGRLADQGNQGNPVFGPYEIASPLGRLGFEAEDLEGDHN
jgi:hypothetical protein